MGRERVEEWMVAFWKVAGLGNKNREFWERLREWFGDIEDIDG